MPKKIPSAKGLGPNSSDARKFYKQQLARLRRRQAKQNPQEAGTRNRDGLGGYAD